MMACYSNVRSRPEIGDYSPLILAEDDFSLAQITPKNRITVTYQYMMHQYDAMRGYRLARSFGGFIRVTRIFAWRINIMRDRTTKSLAT